MVNGTNNTEHGEDGRFVSGGGSNWREVARRHKIGEDARSASDKANSVDTSAGDKGSFAKAIRAHRDAEEAHKTAASKYSAAGDAEGAAYHVAKASEHGRAAFHHEANLGGGTSNAERVRDVKSQPRHPKHQTFQGHAHVAARKGYVDTAEPDTSGLPVDDEDEEVGQGDRPPQRRSTDNTEHGPDGRFVSGGGAGDTPIGDPRHEQALAGGKVSYSKAEIESAKRGEHHIAFGPEDLGHKKIRVTVESVTGGRATVRTESGGTTKLNHIATLKLIKGHYRKGGTNNAEPDTSGLPIDAEDEEIGQGGRPPQRQIDNTEHGPDGRFITGGGAEEATAAAKAASARARVADKSGNRAEQQGTHGSAYSAHFKAAKIHESEGNKEEAARHMARAEYHEAKFLEVRPRTDNSFTVNPFASEAQRRYLWSQEPDIAEAWAHGEHTSDKNHKMSERTGKDVLSDPHAASGQAAMMSMQRDDAARGHALAAHDASKDGDSAGASRSHIGAAKEHERAALKARKGKDPETADANDSAAAMHRKAASMHAAVVRNAKDALGHGSDASGGGDSGSKKGKVPKGAEAFKHAYKGYDKNVDHPGGTGAHVFEFKTDEEQDKFHGEVGGMPHPYGGRRSILTNSRNSEANFMALTRDELLEPLVANCACESDAVILNSLSDETLAALHRGQRRRIARNAKADSTNADVIGGGEEQAGGEDDDDDADDPAGTDDLKVRGKGRFAGNARDDNDEEEDDDEETRNSDKEDDIETYNADDDSDGEDDDEIKPPRLRSGAGRGDTIALPARNQHMTMKEMLANASPQEQAVWNHAVEIEKRERTALVRRLVANVADKAQRQRLANNLMRKPLGELRDMLTLVPPPVQNRMVPRREPTQDYTGAAGGFDGPTVNRGGEQEEMLDILTMNELDGEEKPAKKAL